MTTDEIIHGLEQCLGCACANPTDTVNAAITALRSLEAARKDAARYRWLRAGNGYAPEEECIRGGTELDELCDRGIDFDSSMEQPK